MLWMFLTAEFRCLNLIVGNNPVLRYIPQGHMAGLTMPIKCSGVVIY